jgi:hypothetical protein
VHRWLAIAGWHSLQQVAGSAAPGLAGNELLGGVTGVRPEAGDQREVQRAQRGRRRAARPVPHRPRGVAAATSLRRACVRHGRRHVRCSRDALLDAPCWQVAVC